MKSHLNIRCRRNGEVLASKCRWATGLWDRTVGLLTTESLPEREGLLIEPCKQVHTFFMRFTIDVVFLDAKNEVLLWQTLPPWRISSLRLKARKVLELPAGACQRAGLIVGDILELEKCSS